MSLRQDRTSASLAVLFVALFGWHVEAAEVSHYVGIGESLASIALDHYGTEQAAELVRHHNGLDGGAPLLVGSELRIPLPDERVLAETTSWSALAHEHWGNAKLAIDLAEMNGGTPDTDVPAGTRVRLPLLVVYVVQPGNNMFRLARRFYGSDRHAAMLKRLNQKENAGRLLIDERISLPAIAYQRPPARLARVTPPSPAPPKPASTPTPEPAPAMGPVATAPPARDLVKELRRGVNAYLDGRYEESLDQLEQLRSSVLTQGDPATQAELLSHLVFLYVAFDRSDRACDSYRALRQIESTPSWDPDLVSPKILRTVTSCGS